MKTGKILGVFFPATLIVLALVLFYNGPSLASPPPFVSDVEASASGSVYGQVVNPDGSVISTSLAICLNHFHPDGYVDWQTCGDAPGTDQQGNGRFSLDPAGAPPELIPGIFILQTEHPWGSSYYRSVPRPVFLTDTALLIDTGNVTLTYASFAGIVYEPDGSTPATEGEVKVYKTAGSWRHVAQSAYAQGPYRVGGVPSGTDMALVAHPPFDSTWWDSAPITVSVAPGSQYQHNATQIRNLRLRQSNLTGQVVYPDGSPVTWLYSGTEVVGQPWVTVVAPAPGNALHLDRSATSRGEFGFLVPPGHYLAWAEPKGQLASTHTRSIPRPIDVVTLTPREPLTLTFPSFSGMILDPAGQPVSGCLFVHLETPGGEEVAYEWHCDPQQPYRLGGIWGGQYWLYADPPEGSGLFPTRRQLVTVEEGSQYSPSGTQHIDLTLSGPQLNVLVERPDGRPVAARVVLRNDQGFEDTRQAEPGLPARFGGLTPGASFWLQAWPTEADIPALANSGEISAYASEVPYTLTLTLRVPNVTGVVETPEGGTLPPAWDEQHSPAPYPAGVNVRTADWSVDAWVPTNAAGQFSLALPPGEYRLQAHPRWSLTFSYTQSIPRPFALTGTLPTAQALVVTGTTPYDAGPVRLTYPSFTGVVHDPTGQVVLDCLDVWLTTLSDEWVAGTQYCGNRGPYRMGGVPAGRYLLRAGPPERPGWFPSLPKPVDVAPDSQYVVSGTQVVDLYLVGTQLAVLVQRPDGTPVAAAVSLWNDQGFEDTRPATSDLPALFGGLPVGQRFQLQAWPTETDIPALANSAPETVVVSATPFTVTLVLRVSNVVGVVRTPEDGPLPPAHDEQGNPAPHPAEVNIHTPDRRVDVWVPTNAAGQFGLVMPPGEYLLQAHPKWSTVFSYTQSIARPLILTDTPPVASSLVLTGTAPYDAGPVRLTYPSFTGMVYDPTGQVVLDCLDVWLTTEAGQWVADAPYCGRQGPYRLGGVPDGLYLLRASAPAGSPWFDSLPRWAYISAGSQYYPHGTQNVDLTLAGPQLNVLVERPDGRPVAARVVLRNDQGFEDVRHAEPGLPARFGGLTPGASFWLQAWPTEADIPALANSVEIPVYASSVPLTLTLTLRVPNVTGVVETPEGGTLPPAWDEQHTLAPHPAAVNVRTADWSVDAWVPTNAAGQFGLALPPGEYRLDAHPKWSLTFSYTQSIARPFVLTGTLPTAQALVVTDTSSYDVGPVRLTYPSFTGVVHDPTGRAVPDCLDVWLTTLSDEWVAGTTYCGNQGPYRLGGVPDGVYLLRAAPPDRSPWFASLPKRVYVPAGSQYLVSGTQVVDLYLRGPQLAVLVQRPNGTPVAARVVLRNNAGFEDIRSADPGVPIVFGGLTPGESLQLQAWPTETDIPNLANSAEKTIAVGTTPFTVTLVLRWPNVVGTVRTPEGGTLPPAHDERGNPAPHPAQVQVQNQDWTLSLQVPTNMAGQFSLALPPGDYVLQAHPMWSTAVSYTQSIARPFAVTDTAVLQNVGWVRLTYPRVVGIVKTPGPNGLAVSTDVKMWANNRSYEDWGQTIARPDGDVIPFRFGGMPAGSYLAQSEPPWNNLAGFGPSNVYAFDVIPGSQYLPGYTERITLELQAANLAGVLRFPAGAGPAGATCPLIGCPVPGVAVRVRADDWSFGADTGTGEDGHFAFSGLKAGVLYRVEFFLPDYLKLNWNPPAPPFTFTLNSPLDRIDHTFYLVPAPQTKRVTGVVVYENGVRVSDAQIVAHHQESGQWAATPARPDGSYDLYLHGGRWQLNVKPPPAGANWYPPTDGQWVAFSWDERVPETRTVNFTVTQVSFLAVTGRVLDPNGNPPPQGAAGVALCTDEGRCFETGVGATGAFRLMVLPKTYRARVWVNPATGLLPPLNNGFYVAVTDTLDLGTLWLRAQTDRTAHVSGRTIITPTGEGLTNVEIQAWTDGGDWASTRTITNGEYALSLFPGRWHGRPALSPEQQQLYYVLPPQEREGNLEAGQTISNVNFFVQRRDAQILGQVVDQANQVLTDVEATVEAHACANGRCEVVDKTAVRSGAFALRVLGGYTYTLEIGLPPGSRYTPGPRPGLRVEAGQVVTGAQIVLLQSRVRIHGHLVEGNVPVQIYAAVWGKDLAGHWAEDQLWPGKDPYEYVLYVPAPTQDVTWTLGLGVNPAIGYLADPAAYTVVITPGTTEVEQIMFVKRLDTLITGTAWLDRVGGAPAPHILVYADGWPAGSVQGATGMLHLESQTDASGQFTITARPGNYVVGAYPLPDPAFATLVPPERVPWSSPANNPVNLVFRSRPAVGGVEISGGLSVTPTEALALDAPILIFGRADDGSVAQVTGTLQGGYRLPVTAQTTWHLWAAYEDPVNHQFYRSEQLDVAVEGANVPGADLRLARAGVPLPSGKCWEVDSARFNRLSLPAWEGLPEPLIEIQAGTFSGTVQICATPAVALPNGQNLVGFAYEMEARDGQGNLITQNFNKPVRLIFYFDAGLLPAGADPANLLPAYYSTTRQEWTPLDNPFVDVTDQFVTGKINHFTRMGVWSTPAPSTPPGVPLTGVEIAGPATGTTGDAYEFTATASPVSATLPITYTWQATGQTTIVHAGVNGLTDTVALSWASPGPKTITVTAVNAAGVVVTGTHLVDVAPLASIVPLSGVAISGPSVGDPGHAYEFTATASPVSATLPITYTWQATGQTTIVHAGVSGLTDTIALSWESPGPKTITVTAVNAAGAVVTGTHSINLGAPTRYTYLPMVVKNQAALQRSAAGAARVR